MPRQASTRTTQQSTKPASTTRAASTKAPASSTRAGLEKAIKTEVEKAARANRTTRSNGKPPAARRKPADAPFRAVTLVTESYLEIEGLKEDFDLTSCPRCAAIVPSGDKAQAAHKGFHEQIDGLDQRA